ncbi:MAG: hypothetical protein U0L61_08075 [Alistipes sp.]|nr:hypothetical protein [Alistipes sp.]
MKKLLLMFAAVATLFTACNKDTNCGHEFIEHDFSKDLVGTWTYFADNGQAEAMVIKEDGSFAITGIMQGGYLYEEKGTIKVVNNKVTLAFDGDKETFEGRLEFVAGKSMSIVMFDDNDARLTYDYCANDLSDEIIGMWVLNDGVAGMSIQTYQEDGKCIYTGFSLGTNDYMTNFESTYEVLGDMLFQKTGDRYFATRCTYIPNGTSLGDILSTTSTILINDEYVTSSYSFLRIRQYLNFTDKKYDYITSYVTSAKGKDEDFYIVGNTFNMADVEVRDFDVMFRSVLFALELNANSIRQHFIVNGTDVEFDIPITVEGNKVTLNLSTANPAYRNVDMYMFQDQDDTQLHIYMPTSTFVNYFANLEITTMLTEGRIDTTDAAAIEKVYTNMEARVESINVSFVMKARK